MDVNGILQQANKYKCTADFVKHTGHVIADRNGDTLIDLIHSVLTTADANSMSSALLLSAVGECSPTQLGLVMHNEAVHSSVIVLCRTENMTISHAPSSLRSTAGNYHLGQTLQHLSEKLMTEENEEEFLSLVKVIGSSYVPGCIAAGATLKTLTDHIMSSDLSSFDILNTIDGRFDTVARIMLDHPAYRGDVHKFYVAAITYMRTYSGSYSTKRMSDSLLRLFSISIFNVVTKLLPNDAISLWVKNAYPEDI